MSANSFSLITQGEKKTSPKPQMKQTHSSLATGRGGQDSSQCSPGPDGTLERKLTLPALSCFLQNSQLTALNCITRVCLAGNGQFV